MKIGTMKELQEMARDARKDGFEFEVVECVWRGRPFISEITATKKLPNNGLAGFSYMCCELRQSQLRRIKEAVTKQEPS